jgi:tetratricopeptide (TPR) repeat protein
VNAHLYAARDARRAKRWADAVASYKEAAKLAPDDPLLLNSVAWFLVTVDDKTQRDPKRAVELARRAVELTDEGSGAFLDTLAEALHQTGELEEATERAEAAAKLDPQPEIRARAERFRKELEERRARPPAPKIVEAPETPETVGEEEAVPDGPARTVKADEADEPADASATNATNATDEAGATRTPSWALMAMVLAGLVCAGGVALALRRGLRALR